MRRNRIWIFAALTLSLIGWAALSSHDADWRNSASRTIAQVMDGRFKFAALSANFASRRLLPSPEIGMTIRLRDADPVLATDGDETVAQGTPLPPERLKALLDRLPPLEVRPEDRSPFEVREGTPPPPLAGSDISLPFPSQERDVPAPTDYEGPLQITRYAPVGEIPLAGTLNITFSEPMVAVGAQDAAAKFVPARLTPEPEGRWRWLGTQTLVFEPNVRFPAATNYRVSVPAGTRSAHGNRLEEELAFEFATPPPKLISSFPRGGSVGLEPILFMEFDQRVNAEALLDHVQLKGRKKRELRIATVDEISSNEEVQGLVDHAKPGRWIAFTPKKRLRAGRAFNVLVSKGMPSDEGERTTEVDQEYQFSTFEKLAIDDHSCREPKGCRPSTQWWIRFNNPLDEEQKLGIKVQPEIAYQAIDINQRHVVISGEIDPSTRYRVTVPANTRDQFEQTLGTSEVLELNIGPAMRQLHGPAGPLVTVNPFRPPGLSLISTNNSRLNIRINRVQPKDWHAYNVWYRDNRRVGGFDKGELVHDDSIEIDDNNRLHRTTVDLRPYLDGRHGHFVVWVETDDRSQARKLVADEKIGATAQDKRENRRRWARLPGYELVYWLQVTELGITSMSDSKAVTSWVTGLEDGLGIDGAKVSLDPAIASDVFTDESGLARQAILQPTKIDPILIARKGGDSALLPQHNIGRFINSAERDKTFLWYQFSDRELYRPGEIVNLKGWLRDFTLDGDPKLSLPGKDVEGVEWSLLDARGEILDEGVADLADHGGFHIDSTIPNEAGLGRAHFSFAAIENGQRNTSMPAYHEIAIQEFRRPEFEVGSKFESDQHVIGDTAIAGVSASYYAGGGLATAPVSWRVRAESGHYTPPNHDSYHFGTWVPWWGHRWRPNLDLANREFTGTTDADGRHRLAIDLLSLDTPRAVVVSAEASVQDKNRQSWSSRSTTLVHPAELYVGLSTARTFFQAGEEIDFESVVVDIEGNRVPDTKVALRIEKIEGVDRRQGVDAGTRPKFGDCTRISATRPTTCQFAFERGGSYRAVAEIEDNEGRRNVSELNFWVAGSNQSASRSLDRESVQLIPDRKEYQPGDVAEILVQAPFFPAEGLVILGNNGVISTSRFQVTGPEATVEIPITEHHIAGIDVTVELVGASHSGSDSASRNPRPQVASAGGSIQLEVPPRTRTLDVQLQVRTNPLEPGGSTEIDLQVADSDGKAVSGAEVAVVVVDESVLALTDYAVGDPLDHFYFFTWRGYSIYHQRSLVDMDLEANVEVKTAGGGEVSNSRVRMKRRAGESEMAFAAADIVALGAETAASVGSSSPSLDSNLELRSDFTPLALFAPSIITNEDGRAVVPIELPDSLTRYRIMAIAVSGAEFYGKGESQITARLPLMARPSPPRFLNFGDRFELPVLVQNQTDGDLKVDVAVRSANATFGAQTEDTHSAGVQVTVPANDRVEVRFPASPEGAGEARFQVVATSNGNTDAASFDFPVWTPATSEAFATYGVIDDGAVAQPIAAPDDAWPQFGGLEVTTSSTQLQALTDAVLYLNTYEFECSEQVASRITSVVALGDVLDAFEVEGMPTPAALNTRVEADLVKLAALQNRDGGFGFWRNGERSWPYLTIHVAHAIARAQAKGFEVPSTLADSLASYLKNIDRHIPSNASVRSANALRAYALFVRDLMGDADADAAAKLAQHEDLSIESMGWLLPLLNSQKTELQRGQLLRHLTNLATETAAGAHFVTRYTDGAHLLLHSERRADGIVLAGLIASDPESDLIPKLVRGLLDHRKKGRWNNTQENVFILLALRDYFDRYESETPDFAARFWLGNAYAGEHDFKGRSTDRVQLDIPMSQLLEQPSPTPLTLSKEGTGRLYYRVGMRYSPKSLELEAADYGFTVEREYEAVDDPEDVSRDEDGTWRIKAGARVGVRVTMMNPMRRYHVALVDPLPAGLEPINPALATSERPPAPPNEGQSKYGWWGYGPWYEHQNLRDERVEAFTSLLREGVHTYRYYARATTPGEFVVPPTRAEEMYHPETFGRSASMRVVVE